MGPSPSMMLIQTWVQGGGNSLKVKMNKITMYLNDAIMLITLLFCHRFRPVRQRPVAVRGGCSALLCSALLFGRSSEERRPVTDLAQFMNRCSGAMRSSQRIQTVDHKKIVLNQKNFNV
ncbi:hypothetical protein INR49_030466 [Caranx melampygus]|nr:hypothetical protein INR49_030466 [Caranx melampygus]